ncbi:hypothetical protein PH7735_02273 [Shimia thalassica]|uniref:D-galactarate dehydratase n=1 Tax=Shimia thalassica TaxID=1715693 RepID=A0A0P1IJP4_9RHOB|nr:hypothetical protein [Shimia thalassica]CUJ99926.1 hypothetical protein PH7735_02273 [Shimia thalassica]
MHKVKIGAGVFACLALGACNSLPQWATGDGNAAPAASSEEVAPLPDGTVRPVSRPDGSAVVSPVAATSVSGPLGTTIASLGDPAEAGMWLKTPKVTTNQPGRVTYKGRTQDVTLVPIEGEASAGSRISLSAMQALGIPLTDLAEVSVEAF